MSATDVLAYSVPSAARATGLSATHLRDAIARGELKASRSNRDAEGNPVGKWVIIAADLEAYLASLPEG